MPATDNMEKLGSELRSSRTVAGGFLGNDTRLLETIIAEDRRALEEAGLTLGALADRMDLITSRAVSAMGASVGIEGRWACDAVEVRGWLKCPWGHDGRYSKAVIHCRRVDTGADVTWSCLNLHLIREHGFFEGRGSPFRVEPSTLALVLAD